MRILLFVTTILLLSTAKTQGAELQGTAALVGKSAARNIVVALEGEHKASPLTKVTIDQRDKMFSPHISVVTVGTTVDFPNNDTIYHNVFAYYNAKKFDLGMYPRGATKRVTFDKPGVVAILCNVHSEMSAYIYIANTPYYAITDQQGRFRLRDVPPGTYTLRAWHESGAITSQSLIVKENNSALTLKLLKK